MIELGVHPFIATAALWIVQLPVVVALIYIVFWLSLLIGVAISLQGYWSTPILRGHCCTCSHAHCQCVWCNSLFYDDETWK